MLYKITKCTTLDLLAALGVSNRDSSLKQSRILDKNLFLSENSIEFPKIAIIDQSRFTYLRYRFLSPIYP